MRSSTGRYTAAIGIAFSTALMFGGCAAEESDRTAPGTGRAATLAPATSTTSSQPPATTPASTAPTDPPVVALPLADLSLRLDPVVDVNQPVAMTPRPASGDLYVAEQPGIVRRIAVSGSGPTATYEADETPVLDIRHRIASGGERGLLGLAFSADGTQLYAYFTAPDGSLTAAEYAMNGDIADPESERVLLALAHPLANHNGGQLALGPDGYLYLGPGDGGGAGDPDDNGQNPDTALGAILRIDPTSPDAVRAYGIPEDNPFVDRQSPEVWSYGLRNPWRFSFDRETGDLWIGDVGQSAWEEIDFAPAGPDGTGAGRGLNFGWNFTEGTHPYESQEPPSDWTSPIYEYERVSPYCTVIGGYVYRGSEIPELTGAYLFGDFCDSNILALRQQDGAVTESVDFGLPVPGAGLSSFGEDAAGELYVLSLDGTIFKVRAA